jgi:hypothetical protein
LPQLLLRRQEPGCSAENRFSIAGQRVDRQARDSDSQAEHPLPANTREARAPSILRAQARADLQGPAVRQLLGLGPDLVRVQDSVRVRDSERVQGQAARRRPLKQHAHSAPAPVAAVVASSNTPRPKKAR